MATKKKNIDEVLRMNMEGDGLGDEIGDDDTGLGDTDEEEEENDIDDFDEEE